MTTQRRYRLYVAALFAVSVFLFGMGQLHAAFYTWTGSANDNNWNTATNWSPSAVPGTGDDVYIDIPALINLPTARTVKSFTIAGVVVSLRSDTSLTVTEFMTLTNATLRLGYLTPTRAGFPLVIGAACLLKLDGISGSTIEPYGTPGKDVNIRAYGAIEMGDLRVCHIGQLDAVPNILTRLERSSGQFLSDVRFEGNVVLGERVALGAHSVWLGKNSDNFQTGTGGSKTCFTFIQDHNDQNNPYPGNIGRVVKSAAHWQDTNGDWDTSVEWYIVETGDNVSQGNMSFAVDINYAVEENTWSSSSSEPFPGVSVRYVRMVHPRNGATGNKVVAKYWVVKPVGFVAETNPYFGPHSTTPNLICYGVEFNTSDVSSPSGAYAAVYETNFEENSNLFGQWYTYGSLFGGQNIKGRLYCVICPTFYFGDITIAEGNNPVPVELTTFSARYIRNSVELNWQTATELNNYGFAIERSRDGRVWDEIDFVAGAGTSFSPKSYSYTDRLDDAHRRVPQLVYRLRQIDRDGTTEYSNSVFVKTSVMPAQVELHGAYPNPFNPETTIGFSLRETMPVTVKVFNLYGQEVATLLRNAETDAGFHSLPFRGDNLPSGSYMIVLDAGGVRQQQRMVLSK
jgi:hypothetical protein